MKQKEIDFLMEIARATANRSEAQRKKVGAVVTDSKGNYVASGFNGTIRGYHTNCAEVKEGEVFVTDPTLMVHAEINCIAHAARRGVSIDGGTAIGTYSPCFECTKAMIQSGIVEMIYDEEHHTLAGVEEKYGRYIKLTRWVSP